MAKIKLKNEVFNVQVNETTGQQFPSEFKQALGSLNACLHLTGAQYNTVVKINRLLEAPAKDYEDTRKKIQEIYLKKDDDGEWEIPESMSDKRRKEMNDKFKDLTDNEFEIEFTVLDFPKKKREKLRIPPGHMAILERFGIVKSDFKTAKDDEKEEKETKKKKA